MLKSVNPYKTTLIEEYEELSNDHIDKILHAADKAFYSWRELSLRERTEYIKKCADELQKNIELYAGVITTEMGKTIKESRKEINKCVMMSRYFIEHAHEFLSKEKIELEDGTGFKVYDPLGIILGIMPWNYPFWQFFRFAVPSLLAGNVIVLKHASNVPQSGSYIEEVFEKAGFPEGVMQNLMISSSKINRVIHDKRIRGISLTGSVSAGERVAEETGKKVKKTVLELGGSDPFIVMKDADLQEAAKKAVKARMKNFGQSCDAAKRFIVHESKYEEFLSKMKQEFLDLQFGDPTDENTDYGSLSSEAQKNQLAQQVGESIKMGANVYWQGKKAPSEGAFFNPIILTDITADMPAYNEELFGPVACVFPFKTEKEAVLIANDTEFGLGASVWSADIDHAQKLAREIEAGIVFINEEVSSKPQLPFGGVKKSGVGREMSDIGIREFTNEKAIWVPS